MLLPMTKEYPNLVVGDRLFGIVTPATVHGYVGRNYRPKPYYLLEVQVEEVFGEGADRRHRLSSDFLLFPNRLFKDLAAAKERLVKLFAEETDGTLPIEKVRLVSIEEQATGERLTERDQFIADPQGGVRLMSEAH
jgi:hypothetical protein